MNPQRRLLWFRRLALAGAILAAGVVVLGAWVRLTDAGLGCPDWPGCYGHIYPNAGQSAAQSGSHFAKALHEMIHRYFATTLGIIIASLLVWALRFRKDRGQPLIPVAVLFGVVCLQGALGALTVTLLLKPLIVTAHLLGGLTTLGLLWWLALAPETRAPAEREAAVRKFALVGAAVLAAQIALGGWTSSNYAAVACPDLPTCQHSWWPSMDFRDAFVLWRGIGIDYEGGVLANPARVAIHFTHRLGALAGGFDLDQPRSLGGRKRQAGGPPAAATCRTLAGAGGGAADFASGSRPCIGACLCRWRRCTTRARPFWSSAW